MSNPNEPKNPQNPQRSVTIVEKAPPKPVHNPGQGHDLTTEVLQQAAENLTLGLKVARNIAHDVFKGQDVDPAIVLAIYDKYKLEIDELFDEEEVEDEIDDEEDDE